MTISIQCPHCQKPYKVPEECAGRQATCQNCKKPFKVPAGTFFRHLVRLLAMRTLNRNGHARSSVVQKMGSWPQ